MAVKRNATEGLPMNITGRDDWIMTEALATALVALEQLPQDRRPNSNMDDMRQLLAACGDSLTVSLHLAQAKCRFFPDLDPLDVLESYGIDVNRDGEMA